MTMTNRKRDVNTQISISRLAAEGSETDDQLESERLGEGVHAVDRDVPHAGLDIGDVGLGDADALSDFVLAEVSLFPRLAEVLAKSLAQFPCLVAHVPRYPHN